MSIEVKVTSVLQRVVGAKSVEADGATIGELLADVNERYPGFKDQITADDGNLHRFVNIYLNDEDIRYLQSLDTPLKEGDIVSILPALAGGSDEGSGDLQVATERCTVLDAPPLALCRRESRLDPRNESPVW